MLPLYSCIFIKLNRCEKVQIIDTRYKKEESHIEHCVKLNNFSVTKTPIASHSLLSYTEQISDVTCLFLLDPMDFILLTTLSCGILSNTFPNCMSIISNVLSSLALLVTLLKQFDQIIQENSSL